MAVTVSTLPLAALFAREILSARVQCLGYRSSCVVNMRAAWGDRKVHRWHAEACCKEFPKKTLGKLPTGSGRALQEQRSGRCELWRKALVLKLEQHILGTYAGH